MCYSVRFGLLTVCEWFVYGSIMIVEVCVCGCILTRFLKTMKPWINGNDEDDDSNSNYTTMVNYYCSIVDNSNL